jgi:hypothetical protein
MSDKTEAELAMASGCAAAGCSLYFLIIFLLFLAFIVGGIIYTFATGQGGLY